MPQGLTRGVPTRHLRWLLCRRMVGYSAAVGFPAILSSVALRGRCRLTQPVSPGWASVAAERRVQNRPGMRKSVYHWLRQVVGASEHSGLWTVLGAHQSKSDGHTGAPVFRMSLSGLLCARDLYSVFLGCFVP